MPEKLTYEIVKQRFEEAGLTLLSTEYINSTQKLDYLCSKGHRHSISTGDLSSGRGCPFCWEIRKRESKLTPIATIKEEIESEGYTLITKEYTSGKQVLDAICPKGHEWTTTLSKFRCGYRCKYCARERDIERWTGSTNPMWNPDREAVKQNRKIWTAWRNTIRCGASGRNTSTSEQVEALLGYNWHELREHLRSHPNWEKCKNSYHVDHIFPIKAFLDYGIKDPSVIHALENLQPLDTTKNLKKNCHYDKDKFEEYLREKGLL